MEWRKQMCGHDAFGTVYFYGWYMLMLGLEKLTVLMLIGRGRVLWAVTLLQMSWWLPFRWFSCW